MSAIETELLAAWERERRSRAVIGELRQLLGAETRNCGSGLLEKGLLSADRARPLPDPSVPLALSATWGVRSTGRGAARRRDVLPRRVVGVLPASPDAAGVRIHPRRLRYPRAPITAPPHGKARLSRPSEGCFQYGIETITFEGTNVRVSDPERTLLDALDYPKTFGDCGPPSRSLRRLSIESIADVS